MSPELQERTSESDQGERSDPKDFSAEIQDVLDVEVRKGAKEKVSMRTGQPRHRGHY